MTHPGQPIANPGIDSQVLAVPPAQSVVHQRSTALPERAVWLLKIETPLATALTRQH